MAYTFVLIIAVTARPFSLASACMAEALKVLLVDDDPAMVRLLAKWLEAAGYNVLRAVDGQQAMAIIESECPAILVTDWEMPGMDGLALCRWVREQNLPHYVYTIFLTVRCASSDIVKGLEAGADDFVKKPVDRDELLARMRAGRRVMELERRLCLLASTDPMTGLATRRTFHDVVEREQLRSRRHQLPISCVMLDIDFFKHVNDSHGHQVGDDVIRQIGRILSTNVRGTDIASRYGGEEFCVILPETTEQQAQVWAERVRGLISALRIKAPDGLVSVNASMGVAEQMSDTTSVEQLVDMADQALVVAKRAGRDRVVAYSSLQSQQASSTGADPGALLRGVPARTVMTTIVAALDENDTVGSAASYFLRFRINSAPVVNSAGMLVGVLGEKDLMTIMLGPHWWTKQIKDVMKRNVVSYEEESPALAIYEFLCRVTMRGVVIVNQGRPTGLITRSSLLRYFMNELSVARGGGSNCQPALPESALIDKLQNEPAEERIAAMVQVLSDEIADLSRRLEDGGHDLLPCVVGGASRLQELVNDLLATTAYANERELAPSGEALSWDSPQNDSRLFKDVQLPAGW